MKKKNFKIERLLEGADGEKGYKLIITEQFATISSISGNWKISYQTGTRVYLWLMFCMKEGFKDAVYEFATLAYSLEVCTYTITDESFGHPLMVVKKAMKSILDQLEKERPSDTTEEEDKEILKEERLKQKALDDNN